jgi:hypothetical protein
MTVAALPGAYFNINEVEAVQSDGSSFGSYFPGYSSGGAIIGYTPTSTPSPTPSPTPTPWATVDIQIDPNSYTVADDDWGSAVAARRRQQEPPFDFAVPYCQGHLVVNPQNGDVTEPLTPMIYYTEANCHLFENVTNVHVLFRAFDFNAPRDEAATQSQDEQCVIQGTSASVNGSMLMPGDTTCSTAPQTVPLPLGRASLIDLKVSLSTQHVPDADGYSSRELLLNDASAEYPMIDAGPWNYPPPEQSASSTVVPFPFPGTDQIDGLDTGRALIDCRVRYGDPSNPGCSIRADIREKLKKLYEANRGLPPGDLSNYDAHHIQPIGFGGDNDPLFGVFLPNGAKPNPVNVHCKFTKWWDYVTLPTTKVRPPRPSSCKERNND